LRHHLRPLNLSECNEYIGKRLEISGGSISLFSGTALGAVHGYSGGIPRLINILCDNALLTAYARRNESVEAAIIEEIAKDLQINTLSHRAIGGQESIAGSPEKTFLTPANENTGNRVDPDVVEERVAVEPKVFPLMSGWRRDPSPRCGGTSIDINLDCTKEPEHGCLNATEPPSKIVPRKSFDAIVHALTDALGPMACIILEDHVSAMGESIEAFPESRLDDLLTEISREILNGSMKGRFEQFIATEIHSASGESHL
jgi:hypothetical protein